MSTYLIALSLGPVQSLIEAARRTRDLWCGSWLLSEASKAAALELHAAQPGSLIFPFTENPAEALRPRDKPGDIANTSNIIRASIDADDPEKISRLCERAKGAAEERIARLCLIGKDKLGDKLPLHEDLWDKQIGDILECYSAWTVIRPGETYGAASKRLGGLHAARKATRHFRPAATAPHDALGYGIPKSSLDAARESVLKLKRAERDDPMYRGPMRKLRLAGNEQLDALGVAKRLAGDPEQFTAYARVAADAWVQSLTEEQRQAIRRDYEPLARDDSDLATFVRGNHRTYDSLPVDGELLYRFRLDNARQRRDLTDSEKRHLGGLNGTLKAIAEKVDASGTAFAGPVPYGVILKADGDRMGALLSKAVESEHARAISKALSGFADAVPAIVRKYRGHAIYSGGDDVLAMLPLQQSVDAADELRRCFATALNSIADTLGIAPADRPSLSVGLGIGHVMEPLGSLRQRAEGAEKEAKGNALGTDETRNALAIRLGIRSGAEYGWRSRWDHPTALPDLKKLKQAFADRALPSRIAYDLRAVADRLKGLDKWVAEGESDADKAERSRTLAGMRAAETRRVLARARTEAGEKEIAPDLIDMLAERAASMGIGRLADTLIIARWLAARTAADVGDNEDG
jgi:CRISPR-associated protein Cmr2